MMASGEFIELPKCGIPDNSYIDIRTERLKIDRFAQYYDDHHMREWVRWMNDAETTHFMRHAIREYSRESCETYGKLTQSAGNIFLRILWGVIYIGNITVVCDNLNSRADMSILIGNDWNGRPYRGKGLGKEAWTAAMQWLLEIGFKKVTAGCGSDNTPMIGLAFASGMVADGKRKHHDLRNGKMMDVVHFAKWNSS